MQKISLGKKNFDDLMDASQVVSDAWLIQDEETHVTDFSWWDDYTLIAYAESRASALLNAEDTELLIEELQKRGLT